MCHKSKKELIILKLDFEKAFNKIEHVVIIKVMRHKGFPLRWIQNILTIGTSSILLNGTPGKVFHCRREGGKTRGSAVPFALLIKQRQQDC
jgi:hypothetical protein